MKILVIIHRFNAGDGYHYDEASVKKNYNYYLPSGLGYIISSLKAAGFDVDTLNLNHIQGTVQGIIQNAMTVTHYDLVFVGGVSLYYPNIRDIIKYIRKASPDTKLVCGGGIITAQPDVMFNLLKPDIAVIGEGERTCVEIAEAMESEPRFPQQTPQAPSDPLLCKIGLHAFDEHNTGEYSGSLPGTIIEYECRRCGYIRRRSLWVAL